MFLRFCPCKGKENSKSKWFNLLLKLHVTNSLIKKQRYYSFCSYNWYRKTKSATPKKADLKTLTCLQKTNEAISVGLREQEIRSTTVNKIYFRKKKLLTQKCQLYVKISIFHLPIKRNCV